MNIQIVQLVLLRANAHRFWVDLKGEQRAAIVTAIAAHIENEIDAAVLLSEVVMHQGPNLDAEQIGETLAAAFDDSAIGGLDG